MLRIYGSIKYTQIEPSRSTVYNENTYIFVPFDFYSVHVSKRGTQ